MTFIVTSMYYPILESQYHYLRFHKDYIIWRKSQCVGEVSICPFTMINYSTLITTTAHKNPCNLFSPHAVIFYKSNINRSWRKWRSLSHQRLSSFYAGRNNNRQCHARLIHTFYNNIRVCNSFRKFIRT